jgi:RTX calcium-binding nonapeptide repeat (4 copies)
MMSTRSKCITAASASACGTILLVLAIAGANTVERAGGCARPAKGTNGGERLTGTGKGELLRGRGGADAIRGQAGKDCAYGGRGGDVINAGRGADRIYGGRGDDRILARDGERDEVRCGLGHDDANVDRRDVVRAENHCERVKRLDRASPPQPGPGPQPGPELDLELRSASDLELRFASFESDLDSGTDFGWRCDAPFACSRTAEVGGSRGEYAAKIVTRGGDSDCSCPRMTFQDGFSYGPGDVVWMGGSWYVTDNSKLVWSRLMNLGHFEASGDPDNWYLGLLSRQAGQMEFLARNYNTDSGLSVLATTSIPERRWFDVDVRLKLSPVDGQALTEVYIDGSRIARSTKRNMWSNRPLTFYNAGLSNFYSGNGNTTVYFDAPWLVS